jgi:hypothetical protein
MQQMRSILLHTSSRFHWIWVLPEPALQGILSTSAGKRAAEVYGRFMSGSDLNTDNLGRSGQSLHFRQIVQRRINTGDCASR